MEKNKIKRNIVTLGLTASIALNSSGCVGRTNSQNSSDSSDTISSSFEIDYNEKITEEGKKLEELIIAATYKTSDYALITIDGSIYLTTEKVSYDGYNIIHKYYNVNNGEIVGQYSEVNFTKSDYYSNRSFSVKKGETLVGKKGEIWEYEGIKIVSKDGDKWEYDERTYDISLHDDRYFEGEYGYGANISKQSIWPISRFISSEYFTQDEFNYFNSNSESLHQNLISDYYVLESINVMNKAIVNYIKYYDFLGLHTHYLPVDKTSYYEQPLQKFTCTKNDEINTLLGYRCSYNENDIAYNYVFDKLTWKYIYIGSNKLDSFDSVKIVNIGNKEHRTAAQFIEFFNSEKEVDKNDSIASEINEEIPNNDSIASEINEVIPNNDSLIENVEQEQNKIKASSLVVIDTSMSLCINGPTFEVYNGNLDDYYILSLKEQDEMWNKYTNLSSEDGIWCGAQDNSWVTYVSNDYQTMLSFYNWDINSLDLHIEVGGIEYFNDFLTIKGLTDLIKDEYTEKEINEIYEFLNEQKKELDL